jgi:hypothetical protein
MPIPEAPVTPDREDPDEERFLEEHRREAHASKALRAREYFERMHERQIQRDREAAGLCILCGRTLNRLARRFGAVRHKGCKTFSE